MSFSGERNARLTIRTISFVCLSGAPDISHGRLEKMRKPTKSETIQILMLKQFHHVEITFQNHHFA